ncbi:hypothetical protein OG933_45415 (plasmid) [Streptomyces sp. NBC_00016]|uniref:hypothetical protein n=1 Tax=Streptomyces sp. NBC_00016 TaxID=2975622 RepID=UPI00325541E2
MQIAAVGGGVRLVGNEDLSPDLPAPGQAADEFGYMLLLSQDVLNTVDGRGQLVGTMPEWTAEHAAGVLGLPRGKRWYDAVDMALRGSWSDPLWDTGFLALDVRSVLRAEVRAWHRASVPVHRRGGTRHGRMLSLDAELGHGLSLHDLLAADVELLAPTTRRVFEDDRLNWVLRTLSLEEQQVVYAYAEGQGTTWTEAAAFCGASDPEALGERVRRKAKRLANEQARRTALRRDLMQPASSQPCTTRSNAQ